jgi:iron complex transport system ATP-binding protein
MSALLAYSSAAVGYAAPVVSDVTLEVARGSLVGLIGPNGAGKTTLLRAVTGGARVFSGSVAVDGRDARTYSRTELARVVGVLPQAMPATFAFTARQFVEMGRHAHISRFGDLGPADRAAVERALDLTDTAALAERRVDELSGGDLQRLTLAQALAQEPSVLLLDEPTSHLDLNHRLQILDVVRTLTDDGLSVLAVFHDLDMAARYSDALGVVADGRLLQVGPPDRVLTEDTLRTVFGVAAIIGTDPVTGAVQVLPVVRAEAQRAARGARVLVVSGSGTGAALMRRLVLEGFDVSAGALAVGDTDEQVARALDLPRVQLPPYGSMTARDEQAVAAAAEAARVVVIVATPFGVPNLGNLRAVSGAGARTILVGEMTDALDFTRGEATAIWGRLRDAGAVSCPNAREVVRCVEEATSR